MLSDNLKFLILDLDGTLYNFKGGSFENSELRKKIFENAINYVALRLGRSSQEAESILKEIINEHGENISIALENKFGFVRYDYFNAVWNIPPKEYIETIPNLRPLLEKLVKSFDCVILSDAPRVWLDAVLKELEINDIFNDRAFSGEGDIRKSFGNAFEEILNKFSVTPEQCVVIGDQENTDIIPAKKLGMKTIFINRTGVISDYADYSVKDIKDIGEILGK